MTWESFPSRFPTRASEDGANRPVFHFLIISIISSLLCALAAPVGAQAPSEITYSAHGALEGHRGRIKSLAFSGDGTRLVSGASSGEVFLWDAVEKKRIKQLGKLSGSVDAVAAATVEGTMAAGSSKSQVLAWDQNGAERLKTKVKGKVSALALSPDGRYLAVGTDKKLVTVFDLPTGQKWADLTGHKGRIESMMFDKESKFLVSADRKRTVKRWDIHRRKAVQTFEVGVNLELDCAALTQDHSLICAGAKKGGVDLALGRFIEREYVIIMDGKTGAEIRSIEGHHRTIHGVAFSPVGDVVASCAHDGTVKMWDVQRGNEVGKYEKEIVWDTVAFAPQPSLPDNKILLAAGGNGKAIHLLAVEGIRAPIPEALAGCLDAATKALEQRDYVQAREILSKVLQMVEAHEACKDIEESKRASRGCYNLYQAAVDFQADDRILKQIQQLYREACTTHIAQMMVEGIAKLPEKRVVVVDFVDVFKKETVGGKRLAEDLVTKIKQLAPEVTLIEYRLLDKVVMEMLRDMSTGAFNPDTAKKVGNLTGAAATVAGTIGDRINARLISLETAEIQAIAGPIEAMPPFRP